MPALVIWPIPCTEPDIWKLAGRTLLKLKELTGEESADLSFEPVKDI
ncbi:MAG: hypothetical protein ACTHKA_00695 [Anaerocolumna jejuensis]